MIDKDQPVFVADDDEYFRLALVAILRGPLGFERVIETGSLYAALDQLAATANAGSLVLLDLSMPGMEGPATLGAVRECHPDVTVAVVSASQNRNDVLAALDAGAHGYIPKGFGPNELIRALKVVVGGDIYVPAFLAEFAPDRKSISYTAAKKQAGVHLSEAAKKAEELMASISPRQREVLALLVRGFSNKQIANQLALGEGTVKIHVAALLRNLNVSNRAAAAATGALLFQE